MARMRVKYGVHGIGGIGRNWVCPAPCPRGEVTGRWLLETGVSCRAKRAAGGQDRQLPDGKKMSRRRKHLTVVVVIGLLVCAAFLLPFDQVCGYRTSIDIAAGRHRLQVYIAGLVVARTVKDSKFTKAYRDAIGPPPEPVWRRDGGWKPGVFVNRLYFGESARSAIDVVGMSLAAGDFTAEAKRTVILNFVQLLQADIDYHRASRYADSINDLVSERERAGPISVEELPPTP